MNFKTACEHLESGESVIADGQRFTKLDGEIWVAGRLIIQIDEFIIQYSDREFEQYEMPRSHND